MPTDTACPADADPALYLRLRSIYEQSGDDVPAERRWLLLEALHVVGQTRFLPHLQTHASMLALGWRARNRAEVVGQLARLLLVPLGHVLGRLPMGNSGRSNISAFVPMPIRQDVAALIAGAGELGRQSKKAPHRGAF